MNCKNTHAIEKIIIILAWFFLLINGAIIFNIYFFSPGFFAILEINITNALKRIIMGNASRASSQ
jgi:hypothetical protein